MKLTGKCKKDFEKWLSNKETYWLDGAFDVFYHEDFYRLPFECQFGVLVDFFDSVGICVNAYPIKYTHGFEFWTAINDSLTHEFPFKNRQQAREQAILKANEIYNK